MFAPVNRGVSRLAAAFRIGYAAVFAVAISRLVGVLPVSGDANRALAGTDAFSAIWQAGLVLFGIHLLLIGYLAIRSGFVPKIVGIALAIAGIGYLADAAGKLLIPGYSIGIAAVTGIGEVVLMIWLLINGSSGFGRQHPRHLILPQVHPQTREVGSPSMITHQSTPGMNPAQLPPQVTAMKAIVQDEYGNAADVLRLAEIDRPEIAAGEVLLRVHAAGIDRGVWHLMAGLPYPVRFAGYGIRAPKTKVWGREVAGTVVALGAEVTTLKVGDEVFGIGEGCFAEYAAARADTLAPKPRNLTFVQAAAVSVSALTALQAVRDGADVQPGQQVLIIGASGGVGAFADQIAKTFGAEVTGVCSTSKADVVRFAGADHVIDHTREDITAGARRYDVILDIGGNRSLTHLRRALTDKGTLVIVGGETGGRWLGGFQRQLRAPLLSAFVGQRLRSIMASENSVDMLVLRELIESRAVTPVVDRTYPLSETPAAVTYVEEGRARGKVVITM